MVCVYTDCANNIYYEAFMIICLNPSILVINKDFKILFCPLKFLG